MFDFKDIILIIYIIGTYMVFDSYIMNCEDYDEKRYKGKNSLKFTEYQKMSIFRLKTLRNIQAILFLCLYFIMQ